MDFFRHGKRVMEIGPVDMAKLEVEGRITGAQLAALIAEGVVNASEGAPQEPLVATWTVRDSRRATA
jgi:hypothetical protein